MYFAHIPYCIYHLMKVYSPRFYVMLWYVTCPDEHSYQYEWDYPQINRLSRHCHFHQSNHGSKRPNIMQGNRHRKSSHSDIHAASLLVKTKSEILFLLQTQMRMRNTKNTHSNMHICLVMCINADVHTCMYTTQHIMQVHEIIHMDMYLQEIKSYRHGKSMSYGKIQFKSYQICTNHKCRNYKLGQAIHSVDI